MGLQPDVYPLGRRRAPDPQAWCGEASASWRLRGGGVVISMAKARAALLQIAHPKIAAGLVDHSTFESDPYRRVRTTGQTMGAILFGSPDERTEALRRLRELHAGVRGARPGGDPYRANDPELQWFVLATLVDSDLLVEARYVRLFDERERDAYFAEAQHLFDAFRIPRRLVPASRAELHAAVTSACADLVVGDDARRLAARVFDPNFLRVARGPLVWGYRALLADLLPEHVRVGYGFGARLPFPERLVVASAGRVLPRVPARVRQVRLRPRQRSAHAAGTRDP